MLPNTDPAFRNPLPTTDLMEGEGIMKERTLVGPVDGFIVKMQCAEPDNCTEPCTLDAAWHVACDHDGQGMIFATHAGAESFAHQVGASLPADRRIWRVLRVNKEVTVNDRKHREITLANFKCTTGISPDAKSENGGCTDRAGRHEQTSDPALNSGEE